MLENSKSRFPKIKFVSHLKRKAKLAELEAVTMNENKKKLAAVLVDEDEFLKDYIVNRKWTDINASNKRDDGNSEESFSSESELEQQEQFEHAYNFRFEEPGGTSIRSHARNIEGTVRREDTRRKDKRKSVKDRKKTERQKLMEEVKRLKNLKREEIRRKIGIISLVGGLSGDDTEKIADLTKDFDPDAHDKAMKELYDKKIRREEENAEDAYQELEDEEGNPFKPDFGDLDEEVKLLMKAPEEVNAMENERFEKVRKKMAKVDAKLQAENNLLDDDDDDDDEGNNNDDDEEKDVEEEDESHQKNNENVYSKRALKRWKKELQQKMDEYYALDYEDFVDGLPTRFQYTEVAPSNYGLTTREILTLDDKDLNQIVILKKLAPYREDEGFLSAKNRARARELADKFMTKRREEAKKRNGTTTTNSSGSKRKSKDADDDDADDDEAKEKEEENARKASYAAAAWGKKRSAKNSTAVEADANTSPLDTRSRNAKKNAKKRAKKKAATAAAHA